MVARLNEKRYSTTKSELGLQGAGKVLWKFPSFCQDADQEDWFSVYKDCNPTPPPRWLKSGIGGLILLNELIASKRNTGKFYRT